MTIRITELGVVIPGKVTRKYDEGANTTTLTLSESQVRDAAGSLGLAVSFFDSQVQAKAPEKP